MSTLAISGASGFVGLHLLSQLRTQHEVRGLCRGVPPAGVTGVAWQRTELFSARSTREALRGVDVAYYLVHSMMPSSRLFQGNFHDTDLLLADNFAKACVENRVRRIIYLGGLVPPTGYVSPHLQSRREVEGVLQASGIPVTVLRAGMIVGPGGSSFEILQSLVRKLPVMVLPRWTQSGSQAVFIDDVATVLARAADDPAFIGQTFDLVNGERINYETMLRQMAEALGLRRRMLRVPIASAGFSKLWVQLFGQASRELVSPLIDSLLCELPQMPPAGPIAPLIRYRTFRGMLAEAITRAAPARLMPRRSPAMGHTVRSIQRLPALPTRDAPWIAQEYARWLPRFFRPLIRVRQEGANVEFSTFWLRQPLLVLKAIAADSNADRVKFHIVGGLLTHTRDTGWLEFRQVERKAYTLACIHEFVPALPWPLYLWTQAPIHRWTMLAFARHLQSATG